MTQMPAPLMAAIHQPDALIQPLLALTETPVPPMGAIPLRDVPPLQSFAMTQMYVLLIVVIH